MSKFSKQGEHMLLLLLQNGIDFTKMAYKEREKLKEYAWELYYSSQTVEKKMEAMILIAIAHYYRSVEAYRGKHPNFRIYLQHWLWVQKHRSFNNNDIYFPVVIKQLIDEFGLPEEPKISKGKTDWPAS